MAPTDKQRLRFREAAQPWERIYIAFFIGMFVTAIVAIPIALYGLEALENNLRLIGAVALTLLLTVAFAFGMVFILRKRIAHWLGLPPPGLLRDVYDPTVAGIEALRKARLEEAYLEFKSAAAAGVSFYAWLTIRWWMVSTSIALIGVFATVAGTALLFRHNELLFDQNNLYVDQNRKINEQNRRLRVQNKLLYVQTDVDVREQFARQRERLRELQKVVSQVQRQRRLLDEKMISVRWCGIESQDCSRWRSVEWTADPCAVAAPPEGAECAAVSVQDIRRQAQRDNKWSSQHEYAHRALEVMKQVADGTKLDAGMLDRKLDMCGVALETSDALVNDLQRREELTTVVTQLLRVPLSSDEQSLLGAYHVTVGELGRQLRGTQSRILESLDKIANQCNSRVERDRSRLQEAERQHDALADEVLE